MNHPRLCYAWLMARVVFQRSDSTTVRLILANASALFAFNLWAGHLIFERPVFQIMAAIGNEHAWAVAFLLHFAGVYWRLFDPVSRVAWGLAVNVLGLTVWLLATVAQFFTPAMLATIPSLLPPRLLVAATALFNLTLNVAQILGMVLLGPPLLRLVGARVVFVAAAGVYALVLQVGNERSTQRLSVVR